MRISELSTRSGIPAATIKYYAREGILPAGRRLGHNQTDYDDSHLARLRLIRALLDHGGLSIAKVRQVLAATDNPDIPTLHAMGAAQDALYDHDERPSAESTTRIQELARAQGWQLSPGNPGVPVAAAALDAYQETGRPELADSLDEFARAAEIAAAADLHAVETSGSRERMAETAIVGTVIGDRLLAGLRRMAQEARYRALHPDEHALDVCAGDDCVGGELAVGITGDGESDPGSGG